MKIIAVIMKSLTDRMPRKVALASIVMAITLVIFAVLFFVLGGAHDDAMAANTSLKKNLDQTTRNLKTVKEDRQFILDNREKYEDLIHGDRLVPHTQRVAANQLRNLALQRGLTNLGYTFTAASAAVGSTQTVAGGYRVQAEKLDLKIGAALDTQVYDFLLDIGEAFPGSAVVEQFSIERAPNITTEALNNVSRGRDSGLVRGDIHINWRTAQAQEPDKPAGPAPRGGAK